MKRALTAIEFKKLHPEDSMESLRDHLWCTWVLDKEAKEQCSDYYLIYWCGSYLKEQVINGTVRHNNVQYIINWQDYPSDCYKAQQVIMSFRNCNKLKLAYVIIQQRQ